MSNDDFKFARDFLLALRDNYHAAKAGFVWPRLERFNWAFDWFDDELAAGGHGAKPALKILGDKVETYSFAELSQASSRLANGFRALGAKRGDRLLLMLDAVAPLWITTLAAMKLGLVTIPAATQLAPAEIDDRLARGRPRFIVADGAEAGKFAARGEGAERIAVGAAPEGWRDYTALFSANPHFDPDGDTLADDPLLLYFTAGTTARPRLVLHSHASYPIGHLTTMFGLGVQPGDAHLDVSTPGWAKHAGLSLFAPWNAGACVLALAGRPEPRAILDALVAHQATSFCAPPTVWRQLARLDLGRRQVALREVNSSGEPLDPEIVEQVGRAWGLTLRDSYGQTEATMMIGNPPGQKIVAGSIGRPLPGYRIVLLDGEGLECDHGEIVVALAPRPVGLMRGYQLEEGELGDVEGGCHRTGDIGRRDAEGYITYVGRADELFKSSDYRLSPFELESALIEHPAVAEAAVVPAPDAIRLTIPKAYIALAAGHAPDRAAALSIFTYLHDRLAPYQRIRRIEFGELPKTASGAIRRADLRAREDALAAKGERAEREFRAEDFPEVG
ncbi:MAG: AMP-binding protein [Roseiarcus sp.]|jgi:acetyl-CoA synthetase